MKESVLTLETGRQFTGCSPEWQKHPFYGEVVFTTGMTGYPESLTDPSYAGQILCFTYPLIGNYGIPSKEKWESEKIHAAGVVVNEACLQHSHHEALEPFLEWLKGEYVPLISGVDTRALAKYLRESGSLLGAISAHGEAPETFRDPNREHLVKAACRKSRREFNDGEKRKTILAIDCGMKENIIRCLRELPVHVKQVPFDVDLSKEHYDGLFLSNGPGDPRRCPETIKTVKTAMQQEKPIFGICLGTQIMALAAGADTYKLPFGHRGHNQPCLETATQKCYITSQNHGFAVDEKTLPKEWEVTFRNLNDHSVEGIAHQTKPFFAVQFHPEATPGPRDTLHLFNTFYEMLG